MKVVMRYFDRQREADLRRKQEDRLLLSTVRSTSIALAAR
jgi:hypothetical protein